MKINLYDVKCTRHGRADEYQDGSRNCLPHDETNRQLFPFERALVTVYFDSIIIVSTEYNCNQESPSKQNLN